MANTLTVDSAAAQTLPLPPPVQGVSDNDPLAAAFDLPCVLTLEVPAVSFTVGSLMDLAVGCLVETVAQQNEDLEISVNGQLVGTVEIEVTGDNLAVRLTGIV